MKALLTSGLRSVRDQVRKAGLDVRTLRGRKHWRAGVQIAWHPHEEGLERVFISTVDGFGTPVKFLVRNPDDWVQLHVLGGHFYAEEELKIIQRYYQGGVFLDIGANVGTHSLFAAMILKAPKVIAVEPYPAAYRILRCNIALNDAGDRIEHIPVGLADHTGAATLQTSETSLAVTKVTPSAEGDVRLRAGDDLFGEEEVGYIKIDVEGLEMEVLRGLEKTVARCRPNMLVEVDDSNVPAFSALRAEWRYDVQHTTKPYRANTYFWLRPTETNGSGLSCKPGRD